MNFCTMTFRGRSKIHCCVIGSRWKSGMSLNNNDTGRSNSFGVKAFVKLQLVRTPAVSMAAGFMKLNYSSRVLKINCRFSTLQSRTSSCRHWLHQWEPQMLQQQCFRPIRSHYSKFAGNWKNGNLLCVMNMDSWCPQLRQSSLLQRKSCAWIQDFPLWSWLQRCLFLQSKVLMDVFELGWSFVETISPRSMKRATTLQVRLSPRTQTRSRSMQVEQMELRCAA